MKFVFIDDHPDALSHLISAAASPENTKKLSLTEIVACCPNSDEVFKQSERLNRVVETLKKSGKLTAIEVKSTIVEFSEFVENLPSSESITVVSDLNMHNIGLTSGVANGWTEPSGLLRKAFAYFLKSPNHFVFLHSGQGLAKGEIAMAMQEEGGQAFPISASFDQSLKTQPEQAQAIIDELVAAVGLTRLEWIWKDNRNRSWFADHAHVPHDYEEDINTNEYRDCIKSSLGFNQVSEVIFGLAFHQSIKGLFGAHFAGSIPYKNVLRDKPLCLGSVLIIAMLAQEDSGGDLAGIPELFSSMAQHVAVRPFLRGADETESRRIAVALYHMFRKVFELEGQHNGRLESVDLIDSGFRFTMTWDVSRLFDEARKIDSSNNSGPAIRAGQSIDFRPTNTSQALIGVLNALKWHPGSVLPGENCALNIQAVRKA